MSNGQPNNTTQVYSIWTLPTAHIIYPPPVHQPPLSIALAPIGTCMLSSITPSSLPIPLTLSSITTNMFPSLTLVISLPLTKTLSINVSWYSARMFLTLFFIFHANYLTSLLLKPLTLIN